MRLTVALSGDSVSGAGPGLAQSREGMALLGGVREGFQGKRCLSGS